MSTPFLHPAPSFDDPLALLSACHDRMQSQCTTLKKLSTYLLVHGCDEQARQATRNILRYFDTAGKHHHEDEEHDLFPLLHKLATQRGLFELLPLIENLIAEHRLMEQQWLALRPLLVAIAGGENTALSSTVVEPFAVLYADHIAAEEHILFPKAAAILDQVQLEQRGRVMAARRSVGSQVV